MVKMALVRGRRVLKYGSSFTNGKDGGWIAKRTEKRLGAGGRRREDRRRMNMILRSQTPSLSQEPQS